MFFDWCRRYDADVMAGVALYSSMTYHKVSVGFVHYQSFECCSFRWIRMMMAELGSKNPG